jgi:hypothetical protein
MQDVDRPRKTERINRAICIPALIFDNLHNPRRTESLEGFCCRMDQPDLRLKQSEPENLLDFVRH